MKLSQLSLIILLFFVSEIANAQTIFVTPGRGNRHRYRKPPATRIYQSKFEPSVNLSFGYGFPNVDKEQLVNFSGLGRGNATQTGPMTGAINYRFSRSMGIGVMVTHGKVNVPYYDYTGENVLNGSLDNWAFMLDLVRYIPISNSIVTPYLRTAIGINTWKQDYTASDGAKLNYIENPSEFAYQAGIGANFSLSKNAGLFVEAGYGKYILHGGISFKF